MRAFLCGIEIEGFSDVVDDVFIRAITYFFSGCLRAAAIEEIVSINNGSFFISRWRDGISKWRSILREKAQQHYRRPTQTLRARYVIKSQFFLCGEGRRLRYSSSLSNRTITTLSCSIYKTRLENSINSFERMGLYGRYL